MPRLLSCPTPGTLPVARTAPHPAGARFRRRSLWQFEPCCIGWLDQWPGRVASSRDPKPGDWPRAEASPASRNWT